MQAEGRKQSFFNKIKRSSFFEVLQNLPKKYLIDNVTEIKCKKFFNNTRDCIRSYDVPNTLIKQLKMENDLNTPHFSYVVSFSSCGNYIATGSRQNRASLFGINPQLKSEFGKELKVFSTPSKPVESQVPNSPNNLISITALAFSSCSNYLAIGDSVGCLCIFNSNPSDKDFGNQIEVIGNHNKEITSIAFNPNLFKIDGNDCIMYASVSKDQTGIVYYFDLRTKKSKVAFKIKESDNFRSVDFSCDGMMATGCKNGNIQVFNVRANDESFGKEVLKLQDFKKGVLCVKFSPSGAFLAAGGFEGIVKVYGMCQENSSYGKAIFSLFEDIAWISSISFLPNEEYLIVGNWLGKTNLYGINPSNSDKYGKLVTKIEDLPLSVLSVDYSYNGLLAIGLIDEYCFLYC